MEAACLKRVPLADQGGRVLQLLMGPSSGPCARPSEGRDDTQGRGDLHTRPGGRAPGSSRAVHLILLPTQTGNAHPPASHVPELLEGGAFG